MSVSLIDGHIDDETVKMSAAEIIDYIENKVQIDVGVLSAEEIVKTTEVFEATIELIESAEQLEKDNALLSQEVAELKKVNKDLETESSINEGTMRAYREACENAQDEAVKDFCHFLIDKAENGSVEIYMLPDLVVEWGSPSRKAAKVMNELDDTYIGSHKGRGKLRESDTVALLRIIRSIKARLKRAREIPYIQRPTAWALYHVWREEDCRK